MWTIHRKFISGKVAKSVLARGKTEEESWKVFNDTEAWRGFRENVTFIAVEGHLLSKNIKKNT